MKTFATSAQQLSLPSISSAEDSRARTSAPLASELASAVLAAACGLSSAESFQRCVQAGLWSRMSPAERVRGLMLCSEDWEHSATRAYRSQLALMMSALPTGATEFSSLLPTLTAQQNMLAPSMQKWPSHRNLLPTLSYSAYGTNRGGASGRVGQERPSLQTIAKRMLPTLLSRDARGPGTRRPRDGGADLPQRIGGHLSPTWCEWFLGYPADWTAPVRESLRSATRSSRSAAR